MEKFFMDKFYVENRKSQSDRLDYLLEQMKKESAEYHNLVVPDDYMEKRNLLRSLMNIRMPKAIPAKLSAVQDDFLREEAKEKGIVTWESIPTVKEMYVGTHAFADKISVWQGDITRLAVGAIVNAANSQMLGCFIPCHRCIDNAIHSAAGMQLREACADIMQKKRMRYGKRYEEPTGKAILTKGYNLPADYVIHTVGPIVGYELTEDLCLDLQSCYQSVLKCAVKHGIRSVAFCCISTGEFRFPNDEAAKIAIGTVMKCLERHADGFDRIIFNVFKDLDKKLYEKHLAEAMA